jgi:hypothetical protein
MVILELHHGVIPVAANKDMMPHGEKRDGIRFRTARLN